MRLIFISLFIFMISGVLLLPNFTLPVKVDIPDQIFLQLKSINLTLWDIEDKIRIKEKNKEFDNEFIELARSVYLNNDRRSETKKELNIMFNSEIIEEKSYEKY